MIIIIASLFLISIAFLWLSYGHNVFNKQVQEELKKSGYRNFKNCKVVKIKNIYLIVDQDRTDDAFK